MPKVKIPNAAEECFYIRSTRDENSYWQCGQWVTGVNNATKYPSVQEAECVASLRSLRNIEITKE